MTMRLRPAGNADDPDPPAVPSVVLETCPTDASAPVLLQVMEGDGVAATYLLTMRSLDDMIYSLGVLLRPAANGAFELTRSQPCGRGDEQERRARLPEAERTGLAELPNCVTAPLFQIVERGAGVRPVNYAAYVDYQGERTLAGPAIRNAQNEFGSDRTATVLTLLTQLFSLNFSPGATAPAPARVTVN